MESQGRLKRSHYGEDSSPSSVPQLENSEDTILNEGASSSSSPSNNTKKSRHSFRVSPLLPYDARTNDNIHSSIRICAVLRAILDTPHVQRLRGLNQLGVTYHAYMNVTHSRFEHSLGVAHLAEVMCCRLQSYQPQLGITDKDVLCVKIAGLLHDLGHGPFSHVYDGEFRKQLANNCKEQDGPEYQGIPAVPKDWVHEHASLMMIDALLAHLGLAIDMENLDKPLKQTGDGLWNEGFGILREHAEDSGNESLPLDKDHVLTSRDWVFIKECIMGGPIPPDVNGAVVDKAVPLSLVGRPDPHKEFLYDIVSNRHSGLDVDKIDYYARDKRRAYGTSGEVDTMLVEEAFVAWGRCSKPDTCFRCKHNDIDSNGHNESFEFDWSGRFIDTDEHVKELNLSLARSRSKRNQPKGMHLMICYPDKLVIKAMEFFKTRFSLHSSVYTHKAAKSAEYLVCDILLLADPYFRLPTMKDGEDFPAESPFGHMPSELPISRAMLHPTSYLLLDDSIIKVLELTKSAELRPARKLIERLRNRELYKCVREKRVNKENERIWEMDELTIQKELAEMPVKHDDGGGGAVKLNLHDVIVEKRKLHHGMQDQNPVSLMRFLPKLRKSSLSKPVEDLPECFQANEEDYLAHIPQTFLDRTVRVFCRGTAEQGKLLDHVFEQWVEITKKGDHAPSSFFGGEEAGARMLSQDSDTMTPTREDASSRFASLDQSPIPIGSSHCRKRCRNPALKRKLLEDD